MAFSTVTPRLFQATMQQPDTNATGAFNIGAKLAELRNQNDPNRQFVESLKTRMVEDQKNRAIQNMFRANGVDFKGGSSLMGGVIDPTEALKTISNIKKDQAYADYYGSKAGGASSSIGDSTIDTTTEEGRASYLESIPDPQTRSLVDLLSNGRIRLESISRFPNKDQIVKAASYASGGKYDFANVEARKKFGSEMGSTRRGTAGGQKLAAQTLVGHLNLFNSMVDEMKNSNMPAGNTIVNFAKTQLGHPEVTNFAQAAAVVDSELENLLTGVGATQMGLQHRRTLLNENSSPEQLKGAVSALAHIMQSRIDPLQKNATQMMGEGNEYAQILDQDQQQVLNLLAGGSTSGGATGRVSVIDPQGRRGTISASSLQSAIAKGYRQV